MTGEHAVSTGSAFVLSRRMYVLFPVIQRFGRELVADLKQLNWI